MAENTQGFWDDAEIIHTYTRAQALEDGVLVDVSETAREAGFTVPVAVTQAVWAAIENIPPGKQGFQDVDGRLWDVVYMASLAARCNRDKEIVHYRLIMHEGRRTYKDLQMVIGPGDAGEPVITIMEPNES